MEISWLFLIFVTSFPLSIFQEVEQPSSMVYVQASELFPKKTLASGQWQVSRCAVTIEGWEMVCFSSALKVLRIYEE